MLYFLGHEMYDKAIFYGLVTMKSILKFLIVGIMLYFLGNGLYYHAITYGIIILYLMARGTEMKQRKPGRKYIN